MAFSFLLQSQASLNWLLRTTFPRFSNWMCSGLTALLHRWCASSSIGGRFEARFAGSSQFTLLAGSEQTRDVFVHHVLPIRPVGAAFGAPIIERMANAFAGENFGEAVRRAGVFPLAGAGGDVNVAGG